MLSGYWFNFKRGYITPVGTTKLNKRYVGIPAPAVYTPVILGQTYLPQDFDMNFILFVEGQAYAPFDFVDLPLIIEGQAYAPFDFADIPLIIEGQSYVPFDFANVSRETLGQAYTPLPHGKPTVFTVAVSEGYSSPDTNFKEV